MLSRVADSLYWMSRYIERADGILRMLKINYASSQDDLHEFSWKPVLRIFTYIEEEHANAIAHHSRAVLQYMVTDKENPNSVLNIDMMLLHSIAFAAYPSSINTFGFGVFLSVDLPFIMLMSAMKIVALSILLKMEDAMSGVPETPLVSLSTAISK